MIYYNLNKPTERVDFRTATIQGLGSSKGLFFPEQIPVFSSEFIDSIDTLSKEDIGFHVMSHYTGNTIPDDILRKIIEETISFDIPLVQVTPNIFSLELFHGPTMAFKDVGARFMSRCLGYFMKDSAHAVTVLVATSGDTGGAVASGFLGVAGVRVVILYPAGKVSKVQELQLTTAGENITALAINGSFDDCQALVKQAFSDRDLNEKIFLTSANSINVARWLPQQIYYLLAWKQWKDKKNPPIISVPSGNFGNICAGLLAHQSGLPVKHFIAACNANSVVPDFLQSGQYKVAKAKPTISNAMDVGDPSNFIRVLELFHQRFESLRQTMSSVSVSDKETRKAILSVYKTYKYLSDPHGAVGFLALKQYLEKHPQESGIFLETAHPVKFYDVVEPVIGQKIPIPEFISVLQSRDKKATLMDPDYDSLKELLFLSSHQAPN